jgi:hypothetical protein
MSSEEQKVKIDFSKAKEPPRTINPNDPEAPPIQPDELKLTSDDDTSNPVDKASPVVKANISAG